MLSSSKLIIPLVYLFIATLLVQSHELTLHRPHHSKRSLKNRSLSDILGPVVENAGDLPTPSVDSQIPSSTVLQSTASDTPTVLSLSSTSATPASTSTGVATTAASSNHTASTTSSSTSSSTPTNTSSTLTSTSQTSPTINLTPLPVTNTANVVASTITSTQSISATPTDTDVPQLQSASTKTKTTTVTALIAIAASLGGIAILWTIFRKWKLSSSKEFDRRLNPITNWEPTNEDSGEHGIISALRRAPSSSSSFHSGGGSANGHNPSRSAGYGNEHGLDHDFTAGPVPIGGYADLARASSPNMQQTLGRGPSFNHGYNVHDYDNRVPLHHQYNGGGARY